MTAVYSAAALDYWHAGWRGVIPLPANTKGPPPDGYTGAGGTWPSYPDVMAWAEDWPAANIGLRLPPDVIGIDVDTYDGKQGAATMAKAFEQYGELPPTWSSTSRGPGIGSGIFLFRVPVGLRWPGQVGPDVEIIQTRHRYMVAPPSFHPTGRTYQWLGTANVEPIPDAPVPAPSDLPYLPERWVQGLTSGALAVDIGKANVSRDDVNAWWKAGATAQPCRVTFRRLERVLGELAGGGSRHDTALRAVMAFTHLAGEGHTGTTHALREVYSTWLGAVTSPGAGQRSADAANAEWVRMLSGAVSVAVANGQTPGAMADPCVNPLAGILPDAHTESGVTLHMPTVQGGAASARPSDAPPSVATPSAPPGQGSVGTLPPPWVTGDSASPDALTPGIAGPPSGEVGDTIAPDAPWDRRAVAVALELERLEVRRDARLELAHAEHARSWREPPSYTLRELLALPDEPLSWRVHDVMPLGANVLLAAQFKAGKTTLINELTRAVADGTDFLGAFKVPDAAQVALFNYEVGQAQYGRWLRDRGIVSVDSVHVFNLRGFSIPLTVPMVRNYIIGWLKSRDIQLWVIDPFARAFTGGNENDNAEVGQWLDVIDQIKEEAGVSELVMPTHTGRATFEPGAERARGATRLDDWCDVRWLLTRDEEGARFFRATGRDVDTEETRLEYDALSRAVTLGEGSRPRKASGGANGRQGGAQSAADMVLEVVADEPGASQRKIRAEARNRGLNVNNITLAEAARRLAQQGRLRVETRDLGGGRHVTSHYVIGDVPYAGDVE